MSEIAQIITILWIFFIGYVGLRAFGKPTTTLLFSKENKREFDQLVASNLGNWLAGTNIFGTLTSFATVLVFFLGNAKVFGLWTLFCCISIWLGSFSTNYFTKRILALPRASLLLESENQTGGILASLCWSDSQQGRKTAALIKYMSMLSIFAVIWLEFSLFADIGGDILGLTNVWTKAVMLAISSFAVIFFVLRYGIRGFVFADILQAPIITLSIILIVGGALWLAKDTSIAFSIDFVQPTADTKTILLFILHVTLLNTFLVLATEPHWLRLWAFKQKEIRTQTISTGATAIIWTALIGTGLIASATTNSHETAGTSVIISLVQHLSVLSPSFVVAFWFAAVAALFTTADIQIYSWLIVNNFKPATGVLHEQKLGEIKPTIYAATSSVLFAILYTFVRENSILFEKLIFLIIPFSLNSLPAIAQLVRGQKPTPMPVVIGTTLFIIFGTIGLFQPQSDLFWTLFAVLAPITTATAIFMRKSEKCIQH